MRMIESLYLHFPHCRHFCNYCDFYKTLLTEERDFSKFHQYLDNSWENAQNLLNSNHYQLGKLKTFYIGGGTPSLWGEEGVNYLKKYFHQNQIQIDEDCEFTLEVNPGSWTAQGIKAWRDFGVTRFSLGTQTLNPNIIKFLDRVHTVDEVYQTLNYFNKENLNFSVDFMLGLPESVSAHRHINLELDELINRFEPQHFSLYILTVGKKYVHYDALPSEEFTEKEYLNVAEKLKANGFLHYEVSNFAKPGYESQHNLAYWKGKNVMALGPSATGYLDKGLRFKWKATGPIFDEEILNEEQLKLEKVYLKLRTNLGISFNEFTNDQSILKELNLLSLDWQNRGLIVLENKKIYPTSKGYLVMDSLMDELFKIKNFI